jgi:acetyl-CoA carboxylase carboxyltransferase component
VSLALAPAPEAQLTPIERLEVLCDRGTLDVIRSEVISLAMRDKARSGDGVVGGAGLIDGRPVFCYAQDSAFACGSLGEAHASTIVRVLELADRARAPVVGFIASGGARMQEGVAALGGYGRIFRQTVALSGRVPQISIISGLSAGGGAYSPALTDWVVMTEDSSMFLTGPVVVREALGEHVTADQLGGTRVHERNGVCNFVARNDVDAAFLARDLVTAMARIDGRSVGVIANQPRYLGGVLDAASSQKGAQFVSKCNAFGIPLLVLVDTPGFMPGTRQESAGVIRFGATLVHAFAEATVPRITVILRKAFGGAFITMNSKDLGADYVFAWPQAEIGVMGAEPAVGIMHRRELAAANDPHGLRQQLAQHYAHAQLRPEVAASTGYIDQLITPGETRGRLAWAFRSLAGAA